MIYIISDTHFYHDKIIKYENRPFKNVDEMHKKIILNWNSIVKKKDTIYHLGDFSWLCNIDKMKDLISKLNGYKILIKGNHDRGKSKTWWHTAGFNDVIDGSVILDNFYILSHEPVYLNDNMPYINLHGHLHNRKMENSQYINCSVELTDYKPISFEVLKNKFFVEGDNS